MKYLMIAFEEFDGEVKDVPPGYQKVTCHLIFDIKMGENFRCKSQMVAGGHMTVTPVALTYTPIVSRDSVRICLTITPLNNIKVLVYDIKMHTLQHHVGRKST